MATEQARKPQVDFIRSLSQTDLDDVHVINRSTANTVLTDERQRLLEEIQRGDLDSVRDLARRVDRNVSIVSRDLNALFQADLIRYENNGRSKKPVLAHKNVLVEPLVFDGEVRAGD